jgi:hypothetical protein
MPRKPVEHELIGVLGWQPGILRFRGCIQRLEGMPQAPDNIPKRLVVNWTVEKCDFKQQIREIGYFPTRA